MATFEFDLLNNKNGKMTTFFIMNHLFIEHESIKFLFKTFNNSFKIDYE